MILGEPQYPHQIAQMSSWEYVVLPRTGRFGVLNGSFGGETTGALELRAESGGSLTTALPSYMTAASNPTTSLGQTTSYASATSTSSAGGERGSSRTQGRAEGYYTKSSPPSLGKGQQHLSVATGENNLQDLKGGLVIRDRADHHVIKNFLDKHIFHPHVMQ